MVVGGLLVLLVVLCGCEWLLVAWCGCEWPLILYSLSDYPESMAERMLLEKTSP